MTGFYAASQLYPDAFGALTKAPEEVAPKTGIGSALIGGAQRYGSQFRTGLGGGDEAAKAGIARMEEIEKARPSQVSLEKVKQAYEKDGVLSAAGEALSQVPYAIAEQVPQLASMGAGARAGAMAGRFLGPVGAGVGAGVGALAGQFLSSYVPTAGANLEAQARAQIAEGKPVDVNPLAAYGAAIPGAALDVFTDRLLLGKGVVGRLMGFTDEQVAKKSAQELEKLASEKLLPKLSRSEVSAGTLLKGTAKGTVEIPTEITQQMLERAQAGLPLTSDDALAEYGSAAYQAGLLSPLGGVGRISERSGARGEIAQRKKQAADAAFTAEEAEKNRPENLLKLHDEYTAAKEEGAKLTQAIKQSAPNKKKDPEAYAAWEETSAGLREQSADLTERIKELHDAYKPREDLIKPLVAQREAAQPAAAPEPVFTSPPVTELMDQYDELNQQRDEIGAQMQAAASGEDPQAIIALHDQWQALTKHIDLTGKAVENAGGTTETAVALDKKLDTAQKALAKAAEVGDFDAMRKQAEKLAQIQEKRSLVEGRAPSTAVAEQPETTTPATTVAPPAPTTPQVPLLENKPLSMPKYVFPDGTVATTPYDVELYEAEQFKQKYAPQITPAAVPETQVTQPELFENSPLEQAKKFVLETNKATVSHIAEGLNIKRPEAAALIQQLEKEKVISPLNKRNQREVLRGAPTTEAPATPATPATPETAAPAEAVEQPQSTTETAAPAEAAPVPQGSLAQEAQQGSLFREKGEKPTVGMRAADVDTQIASFRALPVAPNIETVQSISELPPEIQAQMERDGTQSAPGMFHPPTKTIYMVGDNLIDSADAGKTIAHELVGHFGLRGVLDKQYPAVMRAIYQNSKQIRAEADARMQDNPDMSLEVATEESIAERAEKDVSLNWMNRLVNLIRTKLRQWGIWKNAPIGDSEIIRLIRDSHKYVHGVTTKPSETVQALAKIAPTEADIKGHNRVEALYSGRGQKNFKEPVKTIKAYKLFRVKKNEPGKIYPLFIGKNEATAIGEWVPAEHLPTKGFAERPGWHAGILPMAPHLRTKENQMADDRVWAEVEIPADINWQDVADTQKTRDIRDRVPVGGHYRFKTSKMQGGAWIIGGALKVNRVLSNEEVADILNKAGEKDAATREQMRNLELANAFAPSGKPAAPAGLLTKLRAITETPAFKRWFGDSKVVDKNGKPLVVYHGTIVRPDTDNVKSMGDITNFDRLFTTKFRKPSLDTLGSWFSTNPGDRGAQMYAGSGAGSTIYPVYLSIQNPQETTFQLLERRARLLANGKDDGRLLGESEVNAYRKWLKDIGKDGIKIVYDEHNERGSTEFKHQDAWIALEPEQIKSVFNKGEFNPENADILYRSRKPTKSVVAQRTSAADDLMSLYTGMTGASSRDATMAGIKDKTNTRALKLRQRIFDQYAPLIAAVMKGVDSKVIDAFRAQNLMYFLRFGQQRSDIVGQTITSGPPRVRSEKTKAGTEYFYENDAGGPTLVGMAKSLEKAKGYKEEDRENAFTVYLAGQRAEQVGWNKLRFDNPVEAENEYKAVLAHLKQNKADEAAFKEAEKIYQNYNAGLLDFLVQTGAMSKQKASELKSITYVPFYRVDKDGNIRMETGDERRSIRIGNIKSEPRLKELLGDSEQILPVFTSAVQNTSMLINMAMRNQTVKDTAFVLKDLGIASRIVASKGPYADNVVHFRVHGVEHHAIIDNDMYGIPAQMIVEGLEGIKVAMPAIVRMMGVPGDIFRKFTVRNPLYMFRQLVRDPVSAWVQSGTSTIPILDSFSALAKMATGKDTVAQRLQRSGATSSNVLVGDSRDMTKFLEDLTAGKWSLDRAFSKLDTISQQSDAATRQVIYEDSIKKGMSHQQALMRTLESMNFSRRGTSPSMYLLASVTPFMHSQVQGLDVLYRAMRGQLPGADKLQVAQRFAARATMLAMSSMAYALLMQDDEDYKRAKPEERYGNWWVPTLGLTKENWLKIPIPYEIGFLFKALPEAIINMAVGDEKVGPGMEALGRMLSQSQPLSMPQAIKPITEVMLGSSFYSGPIESPNEKEILPKYRYRTNTTEVAKMFGGVAGLSPIEIDHLIRGYTGGVGMAITQMANVFLRAPEAANVQQPTTKLSEVPLIGALFQTSEGRGALDATYKLIEEIQQYKGAYNKLIQDGKPEEAIQFANENASVLAASSMAGYMKKTLGEMSKQARMIKSSPQMTTEQKDAALENLYINQLALSRNFLKNAERTTLR